MSALVPAPGVAARGGPPLDVAASWGRLPPGARAGALAMGAVLLWATWPLLATRAAPAPPMLVFGLAAVVGCALSAARAAAAGTLGAFAATPPRTLAVVGIGLFANNILYLMAMPRIGPAEANVVAYLWPVMLVGLGAWAAGRRLRAAEALGLGVAFLGAAVVIGPRFGAGLDVLGLALAFGSGLAFALYALIRSHGREAGDVIGPGLGVVALLSLAGHWAFEARAALTPSQWLAVVGIGVAPLGLSNMLWDRASRTGRLALVSGIAYATPLVALLLLALFGAAEVGPATALGAVLIVGGAVLAGRAR